MGNACRLVRIFTAIFREINEKQEDNGRREETSRRSNKKDLDTLKCGAFSNVSLLVNSGPHDALNILYLNSSLVVGAVRYSRVEYSTVQYLYIIICWKLHLFVRELLERANPAASKPEAWNILNTVQQSTLCSSVILYFCSRMSNRRDSGGGILRADY